MKKELNSIVIVLFTMTLLFAFNTASAKVVTINSGVDSITFLRSTGESFDHIFTDADFLAAQLGPSAFVVPTDSPWLPNGSTSPSALWINCHETKDPGSALYAIPFTLSNIQTVNLNFYWAIDNRLGDSINSGLFVNGIAVSLINSSRPTEYYDVHFVTKLITPYVVTGQNYLYVYQYDCGVISGSQFTSVITSVPEPVSLLLLALGGLMLRRKQ